MIELTVKEVDDAVAQMLRHRAAQRGVTPEEEHRRILHEALSSVPFHAPTSAFKEYLLSMPDVGLDSDFARIPAPPRDIDFSD